MKEAIEVLQGQMTHHIRERERCEVIGGMGVAVEYHNDAATKLQADIEHLKRKVKKDPRVDGLPDTYKPLLLWLKDELDTGYFVNERGGSFWRRNGAELHNSQLSTDEILFYADPNDIV